MPRKLTPKPRNFWTIVDRAGRYRYVTCHGIPEMFQMRREASSQNVGVKNGDRVIKVTLYHPINNFRRK